MSTSDGAPRDLYLPYAIALAMAVAFIADFVTPLGVAVWIFFLVPLVLCLFGRRPNLPLLVAGAATLLVILGYVLSQRTGDISAGIATVNRGFGIVTFWIVGSVLRQLIASREALRERDWIKEGLARLANRVQGEKTESRLGDDVLGLLCDYVGAPAGALYVVDGGGRLKRVATRGLVGADAAPAEFGPGEGLVGACAADRRLLVVEDLPGGYFRIASALGSASPRRLALVPATADGELTGVLELGFVRRVRALDGELLAAGAESIGIALRSLLYRTRLNELLAETQRQAEELQAQQEELRVANEELEENNRALRESEARLEAQQAELEATNQQVEEQAAALERQRDDLERAQVELVGRAEDLARANRYKSEFLANMSHELRTPLNSTLILSKLLADNRDGNLSAQQVGFAGTIHAAANDLLALINDILDLARVEAGRLDLEPQKVALAPALEALGRLFQPVAEEKGLEYRRELDPLAPETIVTDARRLQQVLRNLLSNAFKFTTAGRVVLAVRPHGDDRIAFEVRDTGIGIAKEHQALIFEAFRQANGGIQRSFGGTGLGLTLSRELAGRLGGELQVASEPGIGSTFTLVLPRSLAVDPEAAPPGTSDDAVTSAPDAAALAGAEAGAKPGAPRTVPEPAGRAGLAPPAPRAPLPTAAQAALMPVPAATVPDDRDVADPGLRTVLAVEDDVRFATILRDLARELGFRALVATTAAEAIVLATRFRPTAVLLDVQLPDDSGLTVLDHFKRTPELRHVPVHVLSVADYAEQALGLGAVGHALKPLAREQLVRAFERLRTRAEPGVRRVLVVEDVEAQRESVRELLASAEVEIVAVGTGAEALAELGRTSYDCVVLDLTLPDMTGYEVLDRMAQDEAYSFPPVIVYTGRALSRDQELQLRRYASSIVVKGARSPERLLDEVTLFLHQVESGLPPEKQRMLRELRGRDEQLDGRRVLLAEDDVRNVYALSSALEPKGLVLDVARNGREALAALERAGGAIELVLMDLMMPEMDGLAAMRAIRARPEWRRLPIIALTAKAMPDDRARCLEAGANDYVTKPIDVDKLVSLIRVWIPK